ncbi:DNA-binding transcriptional MerR regulator [Deinococcus sp. HSC-46F16]|uniref:restriction endonuclease-related protein n=1 Tax=Deinococcus sp. HSC-46F16 TaxID=2910968 RepID=UPI00209EB6F1|nr:hypothetical protein [Deinococcus sp. HSC-46F16]MCP2013410.1 DNA-binding transcriptional MerR regulator [Deinococcus sp. HSC-46F16]
MSLPPDLPLWRGTLKETLEQAGALAERLHLGLALPTERAVRDWRNEGLLTREGRSFTGRNQLEILRIKQLRDQDFPVHAIRDDLLHRDDAALYEALREGLLFPAPEEDEQDALLGETVSLLAGALLRQFEATREGHLVGIYRDIPTEVRQAQALLARLAFEHGEDDRFASVHDLLTACRRPMAEWAPGPIARHPAYATAILIDPEHLVPTEECNQFAEQGGRLDDLVEKRLHEGLTQALARVAEEERADAYTLVRRFIAEHPLATDEELAKARRNPRLNPTVAAFFDRVYQPVHPSETQGGLVARCGHCHGPLTPDGTCRLATCRALHPHARVGARLPADKVRVARPEILRFWCDPAQEELRLYHALREVHGDAVHLYPDEDRCDVSLGPDIGVDVKDYANPVRLAHKLNGGIGGLRLYRRKILAVAARRARTDQYLARLREHLTPQLRRSLEVMGVDEAIELLSKETSHG